MVVPGCALVMGAHFCLQNAGLMMMYHDWSRTGGFDGSVAGEPGRYFRYAPFIRAPPGLPVVLGLWQYVALTYDKISGEAALYLNGNPITQNNLGSFTTQTAADLNLSRKAIGSQRFRICERAEGAAAQ
jgi:hypothetical protein